MGETTCGANIIAPIPMRMPAPVAAIHVHKRSAAGLRRAQINTRMGQDIAIHANPTNICFSGGTAPGNSRVTAITIALNMHIKITA